MAFEGVLRRIAPAWEKAFTANSTEETRAAARKVLKDPAASALLLVVAAKHLLGPEFMDWEPETIWTDLDRVGALASHRDALNAAVAVFTHPQCCWDYRVFGHTVLALNDSPSTPSSFPRPSPEQIVWAVLQITLLCPDPEIEFFDDVPGYVAALLLDAGYATTPDFLAFADDALKAILSSEGKDFAGKVSDAWAETPKESVETKSFDSTAMGVQLQRLAEIRLYVKLRAEAVERGLALF